MSVTDGPQHDTSLYLFVQTC